MSAHDEDAANDGVAGDDLRDLIEQAEDMLHSLRDQTGEAAERLRRDHGGDRILTFDEVDGAVIDPLFR